MFANVPPTAPGVGSDLDRQRVVDRSRGRCRGTCRPAPASRPAARPAPACRCSGSPLPCPSPPASAGRPPPSASRTATPAWACGPAPRCWPPSALPAARPGCRSLSSQAFHVVAEPAGDDARGHRVRLASSPRLPAVFPSGGTLLLLFLYPNFKGSSSSNDGWREVDNPRPEVAGRVRATGCARRSRTSPVNNLSARFRPRRRGRPPAATPGPAAGQPLSSRPIARDGAATGVATLSTAGAGLADATAGRAAGDRAATCPHARRPRPIRPAVVDVFTPARVVGARWITVAGRPVAGPPSPWRSCVPARRIRTPLLAAAHSRGTRPEQLPSIERRSKEPRTEGTPEVSGHGATPAYFGSALGARLLAIHSGRSIKDGKLFRRRS